MARVICILYPERDAGHPEDCIIISGQGDVQSTVRAMKTCTHDLIEKRLDDRRLVDTLDRVLAPAGQVSQAREAAEARAKTAALSPREREVLDGLAAGKPNKVIAYDLGISRRTVEVHRARMLKRLGARSSAEAIRLSVIAALPPLRLPTNGRFRIEALRELQAR